MSTFGDRWLRRDNVGWTGLLGLMTGLGWLSGMAAADRYHAQRRPLTRGVVLGMSTLVGASTALACSLVRPLTA